MQHKTRNGTKGQTVEKLSACLSKRHELVARGSAGCGNGGFGTSKTTGIGCPDATSIDELYTG